MGWPECAQNECAKERQLQPDPSLSVCLNKDSNSREKVFASSLEKGSQLKELVGTDERRGSAQ